MALVKLKLHAAIMLRILLSNKRSVFILIGGKRTTSLPDYLVARISSCAVPATSLADVNEGGFFVGPRHTQLKCPVLGLATDTFQRIFPIQHSQFISYKSTAQSSQNNKNTRIEKSLK